MRFSIPSCTFLVLTAVTLAGASAVDPNGLVILLPKGDRDKLFRTFQPALQVNTEKGCVPASCRRSRRH